MTIFKIYENGKFGYCSKCNKIVKRIYKREDGKYKAFAWYCKRCNIFTLDTEPVMNLYGYAWN